MKKVILVVLVVMIAVAPVFSYAESSGQFLNVEQMREEERNALIMECLKANIRDVNGTALRTTCPKNVPLGVGHKLKFSAYMTTGLWNTKKEGTDFNIVIEYVELITGDEALRFVMSENKFNDHPSDTQEYVIVKLHVTAYQDIDTGKAFGIDRYDFDIVSNNVKIDRASITYDNDNLELYNGGEGDMYVCAMVNKCETGNYLVLMDSYWFALFDAYK